MFDNKGYIIGCMDLEKLEEALKKVKELEPKKYELDNHKMLNIIDEFIEKI